MCVKNIKDERALSAKLSEEGRAFSFVSSGEIIRFTSQNNMLNINSNSNSNRIGKISLTRKRNRFIRFIFFFSLIVIALFKFDQINYSHSLSGNNSAREGLENNSNDNGSNDKGSNDSIISRTSSSGITQRKEEEDDDVDEFGDKIKTNTGDDDEEEEDVVKSEEAEEIQQLQHKKNGRSKRGGRGGGKETNDDHASLLQRLRGNKGGAARKDGAYSAGTSYGSASLGDSAQRKAALERIHTTRLRNVAEFDKYVEVLQQKGVLQAFGFTGSDETHMMPSNDHDFAVDDGSCAGDDWCGMHGVCIKSKCLCISLWEGERCDKPKHMPSGMHAIFKGHHILNRERLREIDDMVLRYQTNPKASGGTHAFALPVSKDLVRFAPAKDPFRGRVYKRCSVIGNAGMLKKYKFGSTIDSSDLVIRFNLAPTEGYKKLVGSKTTLRFVNTIHAGYHEDNEVDVMQMQSQVGVQLYIKFRKEAPKQPLVAFDPQFSEFVSSNVATLPTGGYFAIWFALCNCVKVDVYGFHFRPGYGVSHHYFNAEKPRKGKVAIHDYDLEYAQIKKLAKKGFLTLAEPCVSGCPEHTGIKPANLSPGGACSCKANNPLPVALPGFCRPPGTWSCFLKCNAGETECPGGLHVFVKDQSKLDKVGIPTEAVDNGDAGDCPSSMRDEAYSELKKCAVMSDVPSEFLAKHYLI